MKFDLNLQQTSNIIGINKMGSAASTKLTCPKDYDIDKFKLILKLFDKLDENGDRVVETSELKEISELHVRNKIRLSKELLVTVKSNSQIKLSQLETKKINLIADLNESIERERRNINSELKQLCEYTNTKIDMYTNMSEEGRTHKFLGVVSDKDNHIEFSKFFEYMKTKTDDIHNIDF